MKTRGIPRVAHLAELQRLKSEAFVNLDKALTKLYPRDSRVNVRLSMRQVNPTPADVIHVTDGQHCCESGCISLRTLGPTSPLNKEKS